MAWAAKFSFLQTLEYLNFNRHWHFKIPIPIYNTLYDQIDAQGIFFNYYYFRGLRGGI